jgi:hypothetical protein
LDKEKQMKSELTLKTLQAQGVMTKSALSGDEAVSRRAVILSNLQIENDEERTFIADISSPAVDRDGELVVMQGMDVTEYLNNPILVWNHTYSTPPVGKALAIEETNTGKKAKFKVATTPFATDLWTLIKDGMLGSLSVGFLRRQMFQRGKPGFLEACKAFGVQATAELKQICTKSIMVENSLCCMGVNKEAMILAVATKGLTVAATQLGVDMEPETDTEGEVPAAETIDVGVGAKPLPNEHAARQENPDHFRRMNNIADGVSFIIGFDDNHKSKVQSVRFAADKFSVGDAKEWLKKHDFSDTQFVSATGPGKADTKAEEPPKVVEVPTQTAPLASDPPPPNPTPEEKAVSVPPPVCPACQGALDADGKCGFCTVKALEQGGYLIDSEEQGKHLPTTTGGKPDHHLMGDAYAALTTGFRGNKYEGTGKEEALAKLQKRYKDENLETPGEEKAETPLIVANPPPATAPVPPTPPAPPTAFKVLRKGMAMKTLRYGPYHATEKDREIAKALAAGKIV